MFVFTILLALLAASKCDRFAIAKDRWLHSPGSKIYEAIRTRTRCEEVCRSVEGCVSINFDINDRVCEINFQKRKDLAKDKYVEKGCTFYAERIFDKAVTSDQTKGPEVTSDLTGYPEVTSDLAGSPEVTSDLTGTPEVTSDLTGTPEVTSDLTGTPEVTSDLTGTPEVTSDLTGSPEVTSDLTGTPEVTSDLTGSSEVTSDLTGTPEVTSDLTGNPEVTSDLMGTPEVTSDLTGSSEVTSDLTGTPEVTSDLTGTPEVTSDLTETPEVTSSTPEIISDLTGSPEVTSDWTTPEVTSEWTTPEVTTDHTETTSPEMTTTAMSNIKTVGPCDEASKCRTKICSVDQFSHGWRPGRIENGECFVAYGNNEYHSSTYKSLCDRPGFDWVRGIGLNNCRQTCEGAGLHPVISGYNTLQQMDVAVARAKDSSDVWVPCLQDINVGHYNCGYGEDGGVVFYSDEDCLCSSESESVWMVTCD